MEMTGRVKCINALIMSKEDTLKLHLTSKKKNQCYNVLIDFQTESLPWAVKHPREIPFLHNHALI